LSTAAALFARPPFRPSLVLGCSGAVSGKMIAPKQSRFQLEVGLNLLPIEERGHVIAQSCALNVTVITARCRLLFEFFLFSNS
jgi:hypothetical protein